MKSTEVASPVFYVLVLFSGLYSFSIVPWLLIGGLLLLSIQISEIPFVYLTLCAYLPTVYFFLALSWLAYSREWYRSAVMLVLLPLVSVGLFIYTFVTIALPYRP